MINCCRKSQWQHNAALKAVCSAKHFSHGVSMADHVYQCGTQKCKQDAASNQVGTVCREC